MNVGRDQVKQVLETDGADPLVDWFAGLSRPAAPADLTRRVMARLSEAPRRRRRVRVWMWSPLAAAAAVCVVLLLIPHERGGGIRDAVFVLHAPQATRVELVGDFTDWHRGRLPMEGPDAAGRWSARVALPAGRYEYLFLVEDEQWVSDPLAVTHRPDGFGHRNAVVNL